MKFSTRHLFLLASLFLLNTWLIGYLTAPTCTQFLHHVQYKGVLDIQERLEAALQDPRFDDVPVIDNTINRWVHHRLPPDHPCAEILSDPPRMDVWGNPHRVQIRKIAGSNPRVYSTGEDGISKTDGNDPDDIRSWDDDPGRWYFRRKFAWDISFRMIAAAILTPFCFCWIVKLTGVGNRPSAGKAAGGNQL